MRVNLCFASLVFQGITNGWLGTAKQDGILAMENENVVFLCHLLGCVCLSRQLTQTNLFLLFFRAGIGSGYSEDHAGVVRSGPFYGCERPGSGVRLGSWRRRPTGPGGRRGSRSNPEVK